ncbi:MAG: hypothetical protein ACT4OV_06500 [Microthrixaceae bacterium]
MDPVILASARKHGVQDDDMRHAYRNPIRVFDVDDLAMLIGPDQSGALLEIGVAHATLSCTRWSPGPSSRSSHMPRTIQEILDHGDELAKRFEEYEPKAGDERVLEEYLLERATIARARSERQIVDAVTAARTKGLSWQRIGDILGTSAQAAQQRYGAAVESV